MVELVRRGPLAATAPTGAAVRLQPLADFALATVAARPGSEAILAARLRARGVDLPVGPKRAGTAELSVVGVGPGIWLAVSETSADLAARLAGDLAGLASVADQGSAYSLVRVSGPHARDALAKQLILDLHPRVFGPGDAAVSNFGLINGIVWQEDDTPAFIVAVFRSYAEDLWRSLVSASREFEAA
jgi:sarcosine oxidase subunit gamma